MKKRSVLRSAKMAALKRASDRRAKSCFLVVIFFAIFACMLVTEVFYVEEERWREEKFLSMFSFGEDSSSSPNRFAIMDPLSSRVARELARAKDEDWVNSNESKSMT
ncbi:hypothetical protein CEXT_561861 [Caerostris extrusa]|uniref:Uncharacterized protein n=1 Tax=Caerostris extrusa TaxID=172846 RepID=A0AAV4NFP0_CAEEX|nr:hypothetical protein CEXT_561861 [Caerostris extrusa]